MLQVDEHCSTVHDFRDCVRLVRTEYLEMPGLHLTKCQAQRLWGLDGQRCDAVFDLLVAKNFLKRRRDGAYVRTDIDF